MYTKSPIKETMTLKSHIKFDVFLCHNSKDKPEVEKIQKQLEAEGIRTFLDKFQIQAGDLWANEIVRAIRKSKCAAVFLGNHGLGRYQIKEINKFEGKHFRTDFKVIPILLKDAPEPENLDLTSDCYWMIDELHCVDFRPGRDPEAMKKLIKAIASIDIPLERQENDLISEKGVDYRQLRDLLKAGKWQEADKETFAVMHKASDREKQDFLGYDNIGKFPPTDLRIIDQLWEKYSNKHFGFSVQNRIWESVGGDYEKFGDRIGWRKGMLIFKEWLSYSELTFCVKNAPIGHLPSYRLWFYMRLRA